MTYKEARAYLDEVGKSGIQLGCDTMSALLKKLGNPEKQLKFVHIAGTNGKGSTLSFISSIIQSAGYKTGRYVSPRVFEFNEFVQVNGENISDEAFCRHTETIKAARDEIARAGEPLPSLFECETAISFLHFVEEKCQVVVLECGMGGRDDATNVVENILLNLITPIGFDHMGFLGNTLGEIADVKAGIIKDQAPVCCGPQQEEAKVSIEANAAKFDAPVTYVDMDQMHVYDEMDYAEDGAPLVHYDYKDLKDLRIRMIGRYQLMNSALAIEGARALNQAGILEISDEAIKEGLLKAIWHGRFDTIANKPLVILDGAHNPHGMVQLKASLEYYFTGKKIYGIMGVLADKAYDEECEMMAPLFEKFFTVTPPENPRALEAEKLAAVLKKYHGDVTACESLQDAIDQVLAAAGEDDLILIFGSLSYIGEAAKRVLES